MIATNPAGWMPADRIELPAYGGEFTLPSGVPAFAEPLDRDGAFLVRRLEHAPAGSSGGAAQLRLLGDERPCVIVDGRSIALGRRQAEILALLCLRPGGLTTEQLGTEVYGDDASNSTVRGEVSRLRKLVGLAIETEPVPPRRSRRVRPRPRPHAAAARRGPGGGRALRGAAAAALRRARRRARARRARGLDAPRGDDRRRPRRAVGVGPDAVRARTTRRPGSSVLSALDFRDPRRSQAAAQVGRLRGAG